MSKYAKKFFYVVEYTDMPEKVQRAFREYFDHIQWSNGCYVPFGNWGNTEEGSLGEALIIERWIEATVTELKDARKNGEFCDEEPPVLIHVNW